MLNHTKELLSIVGNQKSGNIPGWLVKDAAKKLEGDKPNTEKAQAIIDQLKNGEMHPALGDKVRKAENEIAEHKQQSPAQTQSRGVRL